MKQGVKINPMLTCCSEYRSKTTSIIRSDFTYLIEGSLSPCFSCRGPRAGDRGEGQKRSARLGFLQRSQVGFPRAQPPIWFLSWRLQVISTGGLVSSGTDRQPEQGCWGLSLARAGVVSSGAAQPGSAFARSFLLLPSWVLA